MSNNVVSLPGGNAAAFEQALIQGDLARLTADQRLSYYHEVCRTVGLNPLTKPFEYITLNGKLVLYARRDCTDQLRKIHKVALTIASREKFEDAYIVTAKASTLDGRTDESIGVVHLGNLKGPELANALMKAETKAKRRVTLSICGLGFLDESEVDDEAATAAAAKAKTVQAMVEAPTETPVENTEPYRVPMGAWAGKLLTEIDTTELATYCLSKRAEAELSKKKIGGAMKEFLERAEAYVCEVAK